MDRSFDLASTQILDRVMPGPVLLASVAGVATSWCWWGTALAAAGFVGANVLVNTWIAREYAAGRDVAYAYRFRRLAVGAVGLPILVASAGPTGLGWLVAVPAVTVLPFYFPDWDVAGPALLLSGLTLGTLAVLGAPWATVFLVAALLSVVAGLTGPLIGALREHHSRLADARAAAEVADRAKSQFLAAMSHELRTPLTAILGFADGLTADIPKDVHDQHVAIVRRSGEHLLQLINEVLDFTRLESGQLPIHHERVYTWSLAQEVCELLEHPAQARGNTLGIHLKSAIPRAFQSDPLRVKQVLVNLVGNAIKFTDAGIVDLELSEVGGSVVFAVRDTGVGIAPEALETVFEAFVQVGDKIRQRAGAGLGLALSRGLAERMGGTLTATSTPGEGSVFRLKLPIGEPVEDWITKPPDKVQEACPRRAAEDGGLGARVLVAEDGHDNQRLIRFLLERAGCAVTMVENGERAVAHITEGAEVDVILMDVSMPVMDGYEAARRLREVGWEGPIVALTAHALPGTRQACQEAGMTAYLAKPFQRDELVKVVRELADSCTGSPTF